MHLTMAILFMTTTTVETLSINEHTQFDYGRFMRHPISTPVEPLDVRFFEGTILSFGGTKDEVYYMRVAWTSWDAPVAKH